jgi:hypothetical protein
MIYILNSAVFIGKPSVGYWYHRYAFNNLLLSLKNMRLSSLTVALLCLREHKFPHSQNTAPHKPVMLDMELCQTSMTLSWSMTYVCPAKTRLQTRVSLTDICPFVHFCFNRKPWFCRCSNSADTTIHCIRCVL